MELEDAWDECPLASDAIAGAGSPALPRNLSTLHTCHVRLIEPAVEGPAVTRQKIMADDLSRLTALQRVVLALTLLDLSAKEVAEMLRIGSARTVEGHRTAIYRKLRVGDREEAKRLLKDHLDELALEALPKLISYREKQVAQARKSLEAIMSKGDLPRIDRP